MITEQFHMTSRITPRRGPGQAVVASQDLPIPHGSSTTGTPQTEPTLVQDLVQQARTGVFREQLSRPPREPEVTSLGQATLETVGDHGPMVPAWP